MYISSLNSGSNGNCYYIGNDEEAVLIDAGISCKETEQRMRRLGLQMDKVKAVFISHEHIDHIKGIEVLAARYRLPVYITAATLGNSKLRIPQEQIRAFKAYEPVMIGSLAIQAFPKFHDANDPHSFLISCDGVHTGVFTDIGACCEHLITHFKQCHAAILEANYDEDMLHNGRYPYHLKKRISGGHGHLSNRQALELYLAHKPAQLSHLLLAHLSKENNSPELVQALFDAHAGQTKIIVATRYEETPVYHIQATTKTEAIKVKYKAPKAVQATLF